MSHARLTHPSRPTVEFYRGQNDEESRTAVANITAELGTDRPPLVHTETRDVRRSIRGSVSAPQRAANDPNTSDWRQALANYADLLEASVDEFQGIGAYSLVDDQLNTSKDAVLEAVEWSLSPGEIYTLDYEASVVIGDGVFEDAPIDRRTPTVDTSLSTMLEVDGVACPGVRELRVRREIGTEVNAIFDRDSAENNDVVITEGPRQTLTFEGVHSGTRSARATADAALRDLLATKTNVTADTYFPGYSLDGFVTNYSSTFDQQRTVGDSQNGSHRYRLEFTVGQRA
jgi:hypothetical protein